MAGLLQPVDLDQPLLGGQGLERGRRWKPHEANEVPAGLGQPGRKHMIAVNQVASGS